MEGRNREVINDLSVHVFSVRQMSHLASGVRGFDISTAALSDVDD